MEWWPKLLEGLNNTFIVDDRWKLFLNGLEVTLIVSLFAIILGFVIGMIMALLKLSEVKPFKFMKKTNRLKNWNPLRTIANIYIDIIRGTPSMVQLVIIYFIIFASVPIDRRIVAVIAFGINSGAYVAEIIRGGILSVNKGQMEAGRSLGLTNAQTMKSIIMPQAIKNILPALGNEFIVLVKETAVIGYIAKIDLMAAALKIQSLTFDFTIPVISVAIIYYVIIKILSFFLNMMEKKLRQSDVR